MASSFARGGSTALSDLLQSYEMKKTGDQVATASGMAKIPAMIFRKRYLILSILCLAVSFFAFMALVQRTTLSFAVPASAASFVVETILARFVLGEYVGPRRAAGVLLVLGGVVLLAR